jgi:protein gp37
MKQAHRFSKPGMPYAGTTKTSAYGPVWTGKVRTVPELLDEPLRWRASQRIFVNSMSDLFHEFVPDEFIDQVFARMLRAQQHTFQVLTKRPRRMLKWFARSPYPLLPNVWIGTSVEDQATADERIPLLLQTPAAVRFISCEPLLGRVDLCETFGMWWNRTMQCFEGTGQAFNRRGREGHTRPGIGWVIVGGESGSRARRFEVEWAHAIIQQCKAAGVPVFVKQIGSRPAYRIDACPIPLNTRDRNGGDPWEWPPALRVREFPQ